MAHSYIKYSLMFVVLVLIQVTVLNQVEFSGYANPYIYVLFVLLLPVNSPRYILLLSAFFVGIVIDIFTDSMGIHAAATVFIAYIRPSVIRMISVRDEDPAEYPGLHQNKFSWFLIYTSVLVFIHHFLLFYLEVFTFKVFFTTFLRVLISSGFTIFIIILSQYIIFRK
jgi:hypothetical protein